MTEIRHTRTNSSQIANPVDEEPQPPPLHPGLSAEESEKKELLNYFGIPEDYEWTCSGQDEKYHHQISKERMEGFKSPSNLSLDVRDERVRLPFESEYL